MPGKYLQKLTKFTEKNPLLLKSYFCSVSYGTPLPAKRVHIEFELSSNPTASPSKTACSDSAKTVRKSLTVEAFPPVLATLPLRSLALTPTSLSVRRHSNVWY